MPTRLNFRALALTFLIGLVVSYILCIAGGVLFGWKMYQIWTPLLPGFTWPISAAGFFYGLLWLILYSYYGAALIVFPYNYLIKEKNF